MAAAREENIPNPDPSVLTTEQLFREIGSLKELMGIQFSSLNEKFELLKRTNEAFPERITEELKHLRGLYDEKFRAVSEKFADNKMAVDKAFESSEKAIVEQNKTTLLAMTKTEGGFAKQIEASDKMIADVKDRVTILESRSQGKNEGVNTVSAVAGWIFGGLMSIASITVAIIALKH